MDRVQYLELVKEFHAYFELPYNDGPGMLKSELGEQRIKHLTEELGEYVIATYQGNQEEQLDALCDLLYVLLGTVIMHGYADIFPEAFSRVHRANMSKVRIPFGEKQGIRKPVGWEAPTFGDLLEGRN